MLAVFLILSAIACGLFWLGSEVLEGDTFAIDRALLRALRTRSDPTIPIGPSWITKGMIDVTALGSGIVLTLVTVCAVGWLVAVGKRAVGTFVAVSVISGALLSSGLKVFFFRPRPDIVPHLVPVTSSSFPSGHAMNSAFVYLTLGILLARAQERQSLKIWLLAVAIMLTMLVGISRVYLGVHWPSDVLAGWGTAALWASLCSIVARKRLDRLDKPPA